MLRSTTRRDACLIFCTLLLAYAYILPRWADWSQTSRLNLVWALVERGTVQIDAYVANTGDYALYEGHAYTDKAPGPSFIALPFYAALLPIIDHPVVSTRLEALAGSGALADTLNPEGTGLRSAKIRAFISQYVLTLIVIGIPSAVAGALLYMFLQMFNLSRGVRLLVVLGYGLGTPAATYASNFYSHQLVAALCLIAFILMVWLRQGSGGAARALLIGLLLGYAMISEYPSVFVGAALGVYALVLLPRAKVGLIIIGGILPVALMAIYNITAFDTPLPAGYTHSALWQDQHQAGFISITYPRVEALWGLTFGFFRGLFVRAPWLLLAIPGFVIWWRGRRLRAELWVTLVSAVSIILFYASSIMWWGGFAAGPRYIVSALPFLAIGAAPAIQALWQGFRRGSEAAGAIVPRLVCILLVMASVALTWVEAVAGQLFPTDAIRATWTGYVLPAWQQGDIARNVGTALGLDGPWSLLPLILAVGILALILFFWPTRTDEKQQRDEQLAAAPVVGPHSSPPIL
jgi:hypothetical protein